MVLRMGSNADPTLNAHRLVAVAREKGSHVAQPMLVEGYVVVEGETANLAQMIGVVLVVFASFISVMIMGDAKIWGNAAIKERAVIKELAPILVHVLYL